MTTTIERRQSGGGGIDRSRVRAISQFVEIGGNTAHALAIMDADKLDFLPVVAEGTGKFLGVVLRKAIERGCRGMGHNADRCAMQNHLKTGVRFAFEDQPLDEGTLKAAATEPVVVVDRQLRPVGIIEREEAR